MVKAPILGGAFESLRSLWIPQADVTCYKGTVVSDQDAKDIFRDAQYQLAFPLVEAYLADFKAKARFLKAGAPIAPQLEEILTRFGANPMMSLYVPLVVTNAPLYVLHDDADLKKIEQSKRINDISDEVPFVNYTATVPAEMSKHIDAAKEIEDLIPTGVVASEQRYNSVSFDATNLFMIPRRYHFVHSDALSSFVESLETRFRQLCVKLTEEQPAPPSDGSTLLGSQEPYGTDAGGEPEN